jgi:hypothetical protein
LVIVAARLDRLEPAQALDNFVSELFTAGFLHGLFDRCASFARALLNPPIKFFVLAFGILQIVIRELGPLLFQLPFRNVPITFDFKFGHMVCFVCLFFRFAANVTTKVF